MIKNKRVEYVGQSVGWSLPRIIELHQWLEVRHGVARLDTKMLKLNREQIVFQVQIPRFNNYQNFQFDLLQ